MDSQYTKAKFWKCALQVNPSGYNEKYRAADHGLSEEEYNQKLLKVCKEENIKVLGIADHGNVDAIDAIRTLMRQHDILVFPGFEITSTEGIHFVCLFSEETSKSQLDQSLGALGLTKSITRCSDNGSWPSNFGGNELLSKIEELGGFAYAAHCTHKGSGILERQAYHVWKNQLLRAAQIPTKLNDLKNESQQGYWQILLNKDPSYRREQPIAIINARDVEKPETLRNSQASCLIRMTNPSFDSFKLAFHDPESRVRLNGDVSKKDYSRIESLKVTGGYLDGIYIEFSEHLNAVIGGRGTGKSTLLECIRYAFELKPIGKNAIKQHNEIIEENLGESKARVKLIIRSSKMNGKRFIIARRYSEDAIVTDEHGTISPFSPSDLMPGIELYGQNEIYEIAKDADYLKLFTRFLEEGQNDSEKKIKDILKALNENRKKLASASNNLASTEDELSRLPKLEEQVNHFKSLGLEDKLKIVPLLEKEKSLLGRVSDEELKNLKDAFLTIRDVLPDTIFLSDKTLENLPHAGNLRIIRTELDKLKRETEELLSTWHGKLEASEVVIGSEIEELKRNIEEDEGKLEKTFREFPSSEGKNGTEIGSEYQRLLRDIENIRPKKAAAQTHKDIVKELERTRKSLLAELSEYRSERSSQFERSLKSLNRKLRGKLRLTLKPESDRTPVINFLISCNLENVGAGRLRWIKEHDDFSPVRLAELIRNGVGSLINSGWGITATVANALVKLKDTEILQIEELELPDDINIELNIAHDGQKNFRVLNKLSTGQQCTAILHLLLLQNKDPLIMDQPEDNLDNAFIADRIVKELRTAKISRQFVFATHNANIPVFGDAEWIGVFHSSGVQAYMPEETQGAIDVPGVRDKAANILEGGKAAFNQRKVKYGY